MKHGGLAKYFEGVACKTLSDVEVDPDRSHQHEFNGVSPLKDLLGGDRRDLLCRFLWLPDEGERSISADGKLTWYDSRESHPTRSEYRLYYSPNPALENVMAGDALYFCLRTDNSALVIVVPSGSTVQNQLNWLFGLGATPTDKFSVQQHDRLQKSAIDYVAGSILDEIGIEAFGSDDSMLERMIQEFGGDFPSTRAFSKFARQTSSISSSASPDDKILDWMYHEESLFRSLERHIVSARLKEGFGDDVDSFVSFSLSVQNRRKSRVGYALENHIEAILIEKGLRYTRQAITEGRTRADFIFPSQACYHDDKFPVSNLLVLSAKTSCKDRWKQVPDDADRITNKHLLTLEPGLSAGQTDAIAKRSIILVIPESIHSTYAPLQMKTIVSFSSFLELAEAKQALGAQ